MNNQGEGAQVGWESFQTVRQGPIPVRRERRKIGQEERQTTAQFWERLGQAERGAHAKIAH